MKRACEDMKRTRCSYIFFLLLFLATWDMTIAKMRMNGPEVRPSLVWKPNYPPPRFVCSPVGRRRLPCEQACTIAALDIPSQRTQGHQVGRQVFLGPVSRVPRARWHQLCRRFHDGGHLSTCAGFQKPSVGNEAVTSA
ncbi:hypothetical protein DPEC_G00031400 [Dallia pectoralis]|uniref:Uncharacterized protein n=1 Tax=Dallia pectoralis TaxID=75939 RepID=A0ACC2HD09_DALPE|nr:hypothetical protein DPEC_G00031400 [Dallia pectoralis]